MNATRAWWEVRLSTRWVLWASCVALAGCAYVSKDEYLEVWDADGDGWPIEDDCAPRNAEIFPFAPDVRGDGCDADCGREADADNDDWPDAADCGVDDPDTYPCSPVEVLGDGVDHDCDGTDDVRLDGCVTDDPDFPAATTPAQCGA